MATLFDPPKAPNPPPAPTLSQAQVDANASQAMMLRAGAVGEQETVLTKGVQAPQVQKAALLGGMASSST